MSHFEAAGIAVYALSYDEPDALRDFRKAHQITYPLLSDPDSKVISDFGILNTLIDPEDHPWYGIPYPGTYVINADGVITHKFFDNNLAVRVGPEQLLRAANGENIAAVQTTSANSNDSTFAVSFAGESLVPTVQRDLIVRFEVPDGRHVYADPAPAGSVAVTVQLDANEHLVQRPLVRPKHSPHTLGSSGERFNVHTGHFELRLPITVNVANIRKVPEVTITGEVQWQTCDDDVCDLPQREQFSLTLPIEQPPAPALGGPGAELEPNAMQHFQQMTARRKVKD